MESMKTGAITESEKGVPQGGVISPVIANMVLDGLRWCYRKTGRYPSHGAIQKTR